MKCWTEFFISLNNVTIWHFFTYKFKQSHVYWTRKMGVPNNVCSECSTYICRNLRAIVHIANSLSLSCFLGSKCPYFWLVDFMFAPFGFNLVESARWRNWKYPRYILLSTLISGYIFDNDSCTWLFAVFTAFTLLTGIYKSRIILLFPGRFRQINTFQLD